VATFEAGPALTASWPVLDRAASLAAVAGTF
jgi:hypothetical protein